MTVTLLVVGHDPSTALGSRLADATPVATLDALEGGIEAAPRPVGVVVGPLGDPVAAARRAITRDVPVLIEAPGGLAADDLAALAGSARAYVALRRRLESDVRWARGRVAAGGIGLTWGIHAEVLASRAPDPMTEAIDLLDACTVMSGCPPITTRRFGRGRDAAATWLVELGHGARGHIVVRMAGASERASGEPELAGVRLLASHGFVSADLDGPVQRAQGHAGGRAEHVGSDGAERVLAAFRQVVAGTGGSSAVPLAAVVAIRRLLDERRGGRQQHT
jgi:hypothetical protein